jgi:prepilin-type N-terminal cleavage/methylation domain-containing protein
MPLRHSRENMKKQNKGYSLIEILMSVMIVSLVILYSTGIFLNNYSISSYSAHISEGTRLAQETLITMKNTEFPALIAALGETTNQVTRGDMTYTVTRRISRHSANPADVNYGLLNLQVTVEWNDRTYADISPGQAAMRQSGSTHKVEIESAVSPVSRY